MPNKWTRGHNCVWRNLFFLHFKTWPQVLNCSVHTWCTEHFPRTYITEHNPCDDPTEHIPCICHKTHSFSLRYWTQSPCTYATDKSWNCFWHEEPRHKLHGKLWYNTDIWYIQKTPTPFPDKSQCHNFWHFKEKKIFDNYLSHKVCFEGVQLGDLQAISQQILSMSIRNNKTRELREIKLNKK
jgi:hypothetical protein